MAEPVEPVLPADAAANLFRAPVHGEFPLATQVAHPGTPEEWMAFNRYTGNDFVLGVEELVKGPKEGRLGFEEVDPGDLVFLHGIGEELYTFVVHETKKINGGNSDLSGTLILDAKTRAMFGGPNILRDVLIHGSDMMFGFAIEQLRVGGRPEIYMPYKSMGPLLNDHELHGGAMLHLNYLSRFSVGKPEDFPLSEAQRQFLSGILQKPQTIEPVYYQTEVPETLFKPLDVTMDQVYKMLYGGGPLEYLEPVRYRYHVNPETGQIVKFGNPAKDVTVWNYVDQYIEHYRGSANNEFDAIRTALFTYWGLRVGLKPPEDTIGSLASIGISLPNS